MKVKKNTHIKTLALLTTLLFGYTIETIQAQIDTISLPPIYINASRISELIPETNSTKIDSHFIDILSHTQLSSNIQSITQFHVKDYGPSNIATINLRGTSPNHTAILWHGININSPTLGLTDISLIPSYFFNTVTITTGSQSALFGSGAIGGSIHLQDIPDFTAPSFNVQYFLGSYNRHSLSVDNSMRLKKIFLNTKIQYSKAKNDYKYSHQSDQRQQNAQLIQNGFYQKFQYNINKKTTLKGNYWYGNSSKNIPSPVGSSPNLAHQNDNWNRANVTITHQKKNTDIVIRSTLNAEQQTYASATVTETFTKTKHLINEATYKTKLLDGLNLEFGIIHQYLSANSPNLFNFTQQNRISALLTSNWKSKNQKFQSALAIRQEKVTDQMIDKPTIHLSNSFKPYQFLTTHLKLSTSYNLPTFNDLFWKGPFGLANPNLEAEKGKLIEFGLSLKIPKINTKFDINTYSQTVQNLIQWIPQGTLWTPQNIKSVWARGLESKIQYQTKIKKLNILIQIPLTFLKSTNQNKLNETSLNKQLIYTPKLKSGINIHLNYNHTSVATSLNYTGSQFTTTDNNTKNSLPHFLQSNLHISHKTFITKKLHSQFFFTISNLLNQEYQIIQNQALPLINVLIGLKINIPSINR